MPESLKNHDTWGAQVCRVGTRKCTTYQVLSIFTGESVFRNPKVLFGLSPTYLLLLSPRSSLAERSRASSDAFARLSVRKGSSPLARATHPDP